MRTVLNGSVGTCEDADCIEQERRDMRMRTVLNGSVGTCEDVDCIEPERRDM